MKRQLITPLALHKRTTRCTMMDNLVRLFTPNLVLSYDERLDPERLKRALVRVLADYSEYAGRLSRVDGDLSIEHGTGGAIFEITESTLPNAAFQSRTNANSWKLACPTLSVVGILRGKTPLFAARVTQTPNGSVLGVTWHHTVGDVYSTMLLVRAWALAYRDQPYEKPTEVSDRSAYLSERLPRSSGELTRWRLLSWREVFGVLGYWLTHPGRRVKLEFSWSEIDAFRAAATRDNPVTAHDALCAHLVLMLRRLDSATRSHLTVAVNYRKRAGLPAILLGNMTDMVSLTVNAGDDAASIASGLRLCINEFATGPLSHHEMLKLRAAHPGALQRLRYWNDYVPGSTVAITSVLGLQDVVFQATAAACAEARPSTSDSREMNWIYESPDRTGLVVDMWLPSPVADRVDQESKSRARLAPVVGGAVRCRLQPWCRAEQLTAASASGSRAT